MCSDQAVGAETRKRKSRRTTARNSWSAPRSSMRGRKRRSDCPPEVWRRRALCQREIRKASGQYPTGRLRIRKAISGARQSRTPATSVTSVRQPYTSLIWAKSGRNSNWPEAELAVINPITGPLRCAKPGVGDGGAENKCRHSGAAADNQSPEQIELPGLRHESGQAHSHGCDGDGERHDPAQCRNGASGRRRTGP